MGYESRLYVMKRSEYAYVSGDGEEKRDIFAIEIARFDMCKMAPSFRDLFTEPTDFDVYGEGDGPIGVDCYGDELAYAPASKVAEWLEAEVERSDYRRLRPLLAFLVSAEAESWDGELVVVHYGY